MIEGPIGAGRGPNQALGAVPPHEHLRLAGLDAARPEAVARQHARGKLTARERIAYLVDAGSFREIGALARPQSAGRDEQVLFADGLVTGTAAIDGRPLVVLALARFVDPSAAPLVARRSS